MNFEDQQLEHLLVGLEDWINVQLLHQTQLYQIGELLIHIGSQMVFSETSNIEEAKITIQDAVVSAMKVLNHGGSS